MTGKVTRIESAKRVHTTIEALRRRSEEIDCEFDDRVAAEGRRWMAAVERFGECPVPE